MSYIPDTRSKYVYTPFTAKNDRYEPNGYYEGLVPDSKSKLVQAVDLVISEAEETFFSNLGAYAEVLENAGFSLDSIESEDIMSANFPTNNDEISKDVRRIQAIRKCLATHLESFRDEFIVTLLDNIAEGSDEEAEYNRKYKDTFGKDPEAKPSGK